MGKSKKKKRTSREETALINTELRKLSRAWRTPLLVAEKKKGGKGGPIKAEEKDCLTS